MRGESLEFMSKLFFLYVMLFASLTLYADSDDKRSAEIVLEGGIKSDVTFLNFQKKSAPNAVSSFMPGITLGGVMNVWFRECWGLQPELNINFKQTKFTWEQNAGKMQCFGIEVPIYVVGRLSFFQNHYTFMGVGPFTEFACFARWLIADRKVDLLEINENNEPMIQDSQSGFAAILGWEFKDVLSIDISYKLCCFNILQPNSSQGVSLFPQSISIGLVKQIKKK